MLARAPAAMAGGSAVVKMKPEAKLRTKSTAPPSRRCSRRRRRRPCRASPRSGSPGPSARAPRRRRRRAGRRGRPRAPRRGRSWRRAPRPRRGSRRSARCRRPWNRRSRRRRSSAGPARSSASCRSRSFGSLCFQIRFSQRGVADALDHAGVVQASDRMTQPGSRAPSVRERRPVRDVARGEEQRRRLAVQVGELALEQHVVVGGAGDVAGAAGAGAAAVDRLVHGREHRRVLPHAEVVVRAPDGDLGRPVRRRSAGRAGSRRCSRSSSAKTR